MYFQGKYDSWNADIFEDTDFFSSTKFRASVMKKAEFVVEEITA